jgi:hypothetical protein
VTARRIWLAVDIGLKVGLIGLLLLAVLFPHLPQFEGKAMGGRALVYPLSAFLVPVVWFIWFRRYPYPIAIDILVVLPFFIDTAGNALDLYDSIEWWDDANHLVNWAILTAGAAVALSYLPLGRLNRFALGVGFGALTAIGWELAEYITFIKDSPELATAYTDTLGDLLLGTIGAIIASGLVAYFMPPRGAELTPAHQAVPGTQAHGVPPAGVPGTDKSRSGGPPPPS